MAFIHPSLPTEEGAPIENGRAQLPSAQMVLQVPEDSSGHEGSVNLSGRSFVQ